MNIGPLSSGDLTKTAYQLKKNLSIGLKIQNLKMLKSGPAEDFVSRADPLERSMYGNKGPTRFSQSTHMTEFDEGGQTRELHQPDSGIVKQE